MVIRKMSLGELLDIPPDALKGAEVLHLSAGERIFVENHRGIVDFNPDYICFESLSGIYEIRGQDLVISLLTKDTLLVTGGIEQITLIPAHLRRL